MKRARSTLTRYAALTLCALVFVVPMAFMIVGSLKPEAQVLSEAGSWKAFFPDTVSLEVG